MKRLSTIVLAFVMTAALLAGCGKSSTGDASTASSTPASTDAASSAPADQKPVTLKYMVWNYSDTTKSTDAFIKDMKDKFNITIDLQNVPTDQYTATLKTKLASNDIPDLVMLHSINKQLFGEQTQFDENQFADLSDLKSVADFMPSVIKDRKDNKAGKLYYVPLSSNVLGVMYNKKVFSDNGITIPTNIQEFEAAADKLKAAKIVPIAGGFKDSWATQIIPFIAFGQYVNAKDMNIRVKLADGSMKYADIKDDVKKSLDVQQSWIAKGYFPQDYLGTDINVASTLVGTGKAAMLICGTWQQKTIQDADPNAQIGFFALPLNAPGEKTVVPTNADGGIVINAKSKNLDAAKIAMDFYLSPENQTRIIADLNGISTDTKVTTANPFIADVTKAMAAGVVQPDWWGSNGNYQPASSTFDMAKELQNLVAKGITEDQFIKDYDTINAKK